MWRNLFFSVLLCIITTSLCRANNYYDDAPPAKAIYLKNYTESNAKKYFESAPIQPLEGIWHYPDEEVKISIEQFSSPQFSSKFKYRIVLLSADDHSLLPGTVIGYITDSAQDDKFYMWIYGAQSGSTLMHPQRCVAKLTEDKSIITFQMPEFKFKLRINFSRFLPTLLKGIGISMEKKDEKLPRGFRRIYPSYDANGTSFSTIRYL
ncbi:MAG: hypothetical protein RSA66_01700 [Muribaculaceae bacterium]